MKRLIKCTIWAAVFLSAVLLVQPQSAQAELCASACNTSTPCSTECEIFGGGPTTCGDFSMPCCWESAYTGSGQCFTREWLAGSGTCRERDWDYDSYANMCTSEEWAVLSLTDSNEFSSTQQQCPSFDDCPDPSYY